LDDESNLSYNELHDAFKILYDEYKKLDLNIVLLKKSQACLLFKKDILEKKTYIVVDDSNKMDQLKEKNKVLKEKIDKLNNTLAKSTQGSKILKVMLASQRCVFNKRTKSI
jgi:dynactin complex subunit